MSFFLTRGQSIFSSAAVYGLFFPTRERAGWTGDWLGARTFFSGFPPEINSRLVCEAGFAIERDEVVVYASTDGAERFQWVLACA